MHLYDHLHRLAQRGARERRLGLLTGDPLPSRLALERGAGTWRGPTGCAGRFCCANMRAWWRRGPSST